MPLYLGINMDGFAPRRRWILNVALNMQYAFPVELPNTGCRFL